MHFVFARSSGPGCAQAHPGPALLYALALVAALSSGTVCLAAGHPTVPGSAASAASASAAHKTKAGKPVKALPVVDINSASREKLKTLPGIGDAEAAKIIAGRPYHSKADLVTQQILPGGVYIALKRRIMAGQKSVPPPGSKVKS